MAPQPLPQEPLTAGSDTGFLPIAEPETIAPMARDALEQPMPTPKREPRTPATSEPAPHEPAAMRAEPAPPRPEPEPALPRNAPEIPRVSLELPPESGLVLVETSHAAPPASTNESDMPRPRRVRPPKPATAEEPLQMVETQHKEPPAV
jgi:hypothetical protein